MYMFSKMKSKNLHTIVISLYGVLLLAGAIMSVFKVRYCGFVFLAGSLVAIAEAFWAALEYRSADIAVARRHRLYFIASLFLGIAAWYMLRGSNNWVVMALIWIVIVIYLSFRK